MKKRLLALLLIIVILVGVVPEEVFAYIGDLGFPESNKDPEKVRYGTSNVSIPIMVKIPGMSEPAKTSLSLHYLENDYIRFAINHTGVYSSTLPTLIKAEEGKLPLTSWSQQSFSLTKSKVIAGMPIPTEEALTITSTKISKVDKDGNPAIKVEYTFNNNEVKAYTTYQLVKLDKGSHTEGYYTDTESNIDGSTWGVLSDGYFVYSGSRPSSEIKLNWNNAFGGFPTMGHPSQVTDSSSIPVKIDRHKNYNEPVSTIISSGLAWTETDGRNSEAVGDWGTWYDISEVYTDCYSWANPFVATSNDFYRDKINSLNPYSSFPGEIKYTKGAYGGLSGLTTRDSRSFTGEDYDRYMAYGPKENGKPKIASTQLWGYRDFEVAAEAPSEPDEVDISESSNGLAIFKSGNSYKAEPIINDTELNRLRNTYKSEPVALIRGDFKKDAKGNYKFQGTAAALSPSVTATWTNLNDAFIVSSDGKFSNTANLDLSNPSFKFYSKRVGGSGEDLKINTTAKGLEIIMAPTKNSAVVSVGIPNFKSDVRKVIATTNGKLNFTGDLYLDSIIKGASAIDLKDMEMLIKNGKFTLNGIKAEGSIGAGNILGIDVANVKGKINTFPNEVDYKFDLDISIPAILSVKGNLELGKTNSGELIPNDFYFNVNSSKGIPIAGGLATINGGGVGAYNLISTYNGNYMGLPPIKLRGSLNTTMFELLESKANIVIGPGYFSGHTSDAKIKGLSVMDYAGWELYSQIDKRKVNNIEYTGASIGGNYQIKANFPSKKTNILVFDAGIGANFFAGVNESKKVGYAALAANSKFEGRVQVPDNSPLFAGKRFSGADMQAALSMETFPTNISSFDKLVETAFTSGKAKIGVVATQTILLSTLRIYYITPDTLDFDFKLLGSLDDWNWKDHGFSTALSNQAGQQVGLFGIESSMKTAETNVVSLMNNGEKIVKQVDITNIPDGENGCIAITAKEDVDLEDFKSGLEVTDPDNKTISLEYLKVNNDDEITNSDTANAMTGIAQLKNEQGEPTIQVPSIIVCVGNKTGNYTVKANHEFTLETYATEPFTALNASLENNKITGNVTHPEDSTKYVLRTYLGNEKGSADYLLSQTDLENSQLNNINEELTLEGLIAPSGDYYLSTFLLKEVSYKDEESKSQETALLPVDSKEFSDSEKVTYTNTFEPTAPTSVELTAKGNEIMEAKWSKVDDADGYQIRVYQKEGNDWKDTEVSYQFDTDALADSLKDDTYSLDLAITAGGQGGEDTTEEGAPLARDSALEANKTYKIGVRAYKESKHPELNLENQTPEYTVSLVYGKEKESAEKYLPKYEPLEITVNLNDNNLEADEDGIYRGFINSDNASLKLSADGATFTVTRMDTNVGLTESDGSYAIPDDFEGVLALKIEGKESKNSVEHITSSYLEISKDDTPPIITLDAELFQADSSGAYTISGLTEPGALIGLGEEIASAGEEGIFQISGSLNKDDDNNFIEETISLTATDAAGNVSEPVLAMVVDGSMMQTLTVKGGSGSGDYREGEIVTITATAPSGQVFDRWTTVDGVEFENSNSASTSFTMPGKDITIEAIFKSSSSGSSPTDPPITDPTEPTKPSEPVKDDQISDTDKKIVVDVTKGGTLLTAEQTRNLIEINKTKPVEIQGNGYTITFPIGSMNETAGLTSLNLSLEVIAKAGDDGNSGQGKALLALADGNGLMAFSFKHSGPLPGMARIEITVGKEYAGQTLYYYYHNPKTGKLEYRQSGLVDKEGIITVNQDHCSDYLLSQKLLKNENVAEAPERISGANRYQTAIEIAKEYFKTGTKTVVLARGDSSADALPAVPLAKHYDAPLLLTKSKELPTGVIKTIKELGATDVVLVGGEEAISLDIARELEKSGLTIERIYGINRYETTAAIARKLYKLGSNKEDPRAIIVNGNNAKNTYADALSISSWAGYEGVPLLYADNRTTELPQATAAIIKEQSIIKTYLIGGTEVLSLGLEANLPNPERLGGKDRFATNTTILTKLQTNPTNLFMATGYNYADALAIGAIAARDNSWLLLTGAKDSTNAKNGLTKEQQQLIASKKDALQNFTSVGGEVAVPKATLEAVKSLLKK